jgi:hypothetical protein
MAGIVESLFGDQLPEHLRGAAKGLNPLGTVGGLVDLSGAIMGNQDLPGGTKWWQERGLLQADVTGSPAQTEFAAGILGPGLITKGLGQLTGMVRRARSGIPMTKGEATGDVDTLIKEAQMATKTRYAKRVNAFKRRQAAETEKIARNLTPSSTKLSDSEFAQKATSGFQKYFKMLDDRYKRENQLDFDKALAGGRDHVLIPPSTTAYDDLEREIINEASRVGDNRQDFYIDLLSEADRLLKQPLALGVMKDELQASSRILQDAKAANPMDPKAWDWAKKYDLMLKNAMEKRLQDASKTVPEAQDLIAARNNFKARTEELNDLKDQWLNKFFKLKGDEYLNEDIIVNKLKNMSNGERQFFTKVADNTFPELTDNLRRVLFEEMVGKGVRHGASAIEPTFDGTKVLEHYGKLPKELQDFMLPPTSEGRAKFNTLLNDIRKSTSRVNIGPKGGLSEGASLAVEGAAATHAGVTTAVPRGILQGATELWTNRKAVFNDLYKREPFGAAPGAVVGAAAQGGRELLDSRQETDRIRAAMGQETVPEVSTPSPMPDNGSTGLSEPPTGIPEAEITFTPEELDMARSESVLSQPLTSEAAMRDAMAGPSVQLPDEGDLEADVAREAARIRQLQDELNRLPPNDPRRAILEQEF